MRYSKINLEKAKDQGVAEGTKVLEMKEVTGAALAVGLAVVLATAVVAEDRAQETAAIAALNGSWILDKDSGDGIVRALSIEGYSVTILVGMPEGVAYGEGPWNARLTETDRIGVILSVTGYPVEGLPEWKLEDSDIEIKLTDRDNGELWIGDPHTRWGTLKRSSCGLAIGYRDREDTPPEGCAWLEIKGVGYNGLSGECAWYQDWEDDWAKLRLGPDGAPTPWACLIAVPTGRFD